MTLPREPKKRACVAETPRTRRETRQAGHPLQGRPASHGLPVNQTELCRGDGAPVDARRTAPLSPIPSFECHCPRRGCTPATARMPVSHRGLTAADALGHLDRALVLPNSERPASRARMQVVRKRKVMVGGQAGSLSHQVTADTPSTPNLDLPWS
ncbi:hypothetical protein EXIGLDRAFT_370573 [Exidia glandulosa HHB12029]|uniref:Uncharacterized protein n=1 Tax=Exidia glandulosa HHB12029 TaxID=1314781 RepID=A0A165C1M7_EXIGL|nr:hypothetical protein EXIGLDRAFT_370573 [Exidia glandulosa HHB12029]